jgi:hypothetical protein
VLVGIVLGLTTTWGSALGEAVGVGEGLGELPVAGGPGWQLASIRAPAMRVRIAFMGKSSLRALVA